MTSWGFRITPTAFGTAKEEGARRQRIFPEPERVFRTLFDRWHAFVGDPRLRLPESVPRAVEEHFEVSDYDLRSSTHLVKAGVPAVRGCVGTVRYALAQPDGVPADARRALDCLAAFACFAGLGNRTTVGMGHVVPGPQPRHRKERTARPRPRPHVGSTPPL